MAAVIDERLVIKTVMHQRTTYDEAEDILVLHLCEKPIAREVSQDWNTHVSYAEDGSIVEIVVLEASTQGSSPQQRPQPDPRTTQRCSSSARATDEGEREGHGESPAVSGILEKGPHPEATMRLSPNQARIVREEVAHIFGPEAEVRLFGSRTDDRARGGDIDLIVSLPQPQVDSRRRALRLVARLQQRLGDQKIDVLVTDPQTPEQRIHREALRTGVRL